MRNLNKGLGALAFAVATLTPGCDKAEAPDPAVVCVDATTGELVVGQNEINGRVFECFSHDGEPAAVDVTPCKEGEQRRREPGMNVGRNYPEDPNKVDIVNCESDTENGPIVRVAEYRGVSLEREQ